MGEDAWNRRRMERNKLNPEVKYTVTSSEAKQSSHQTLGNLHVYILQKFLFTAWFSSIFIQICNWNEGTSENVRISSLARFRNTLCSHVQAWEMLQSFGVFPSPPLFVVLCLFDIFKWDVEEQHRMWKILLKVIKVDAPFSVSSYGVCFSLPLAYLLILNGQSFKTSLTSERDSKRIYTASFHPKSLQ